MEVSRKRPHVEDEDSITAKKRVLTGPNGTPQVNGVAKEDMDSANLELFRKEAIYRRMQQYSRENERCLYRIEELEKRKLSCEAGLAAMTACWKHMVKSIRLLVKTDELPEVAEEMFDFTVHLQGDNSSDFEKTLRDNMNATQKLVTHLVKAREDSTAQFHNGSIIRDQGKELSSHITLQTQLDLARANLREADALKERYLQDLQKAEIRFDRLKSKTVSALQSRTPEQRSTEEATEEPQRKPSSPAGSKSPQPNDIDNPTELDVLREQLAAREKTIIELESESSDLRCRNTILETELKQLSYDKIIDNPHYKAVADQVGFLQASLQESRTQADRLTEDLSNLRAARAEWEENVISSANLANQELKTMLSKRDAENARLREQREQQAAELLERKQEDSVKVASLRELKLLNESRMERIAALGSEVARVKARLAADAGDEDLMKFFLKGQTEDAEYFTSLKESVSAAEQRASIAEQALSKYQEAHPDVSKHVQTEVDALHKLAALQVELDKYKTVYGNASAHSSDDTSALLEQLRCKEEEVQRLRLQDIRHTQAETSLYAELDKLSSAWEALERQVKDKVFDLNNLESQLKRAKAKSENKYYAAMRDKDAVSAETSKLQRHVEKQNKVIERLVDAEKSLSSQLNILEKELAALKANSHASKVKVDELDRGNKEWSIRYVGESKRFEKVYKAFQEMESSNQAKRTDLRKLEDGLIRTKKDLEAKVKQREAAGIESNNETELQLMVGRALGSRTAKH
ncbi:hypothetical protein H0H87_005185 [Tephrocybe sp. NHM501043]|nr:hypothetical protein H0H87_005185 [Tephrocybe sp. NHM501043]